MTTVVVPVDGTLETWVALDWCARNLSPGDHVIAVHAACPTSLVSVMTYPPVDIYDSVDDDTIRRWVLPLEEAGISSDLLLMPGQKLSAVQQAAETHLADAVIIAKNVRGPLRDLIAGDVATQLIHLLPCPLLVLPASRKRPRRRRRRQHLRHTTETK